MKFDKTTIAGIIPVLSDSLVTNQETARHFATLLKVSDPAQAEQLYRRIYFTSDGEKPKKMTSVITAKFLKAHPGIEEWFSQEYSRGLGIITQIDNLTRLEATGALLTLAVSMIAKFESPKSSAGPMTLTILSSKPAIC